MRTLLVAGLAGLLALWAASPAQAQLAVSADVPVVYEFREDVLKDPSVSGIKAGLTLPFLVGLGAESYKVDGTTDTVGDYEYRVTMYDLFLDIPFPAANLVLGAGAGKGELDLPDSTITFDDASLGQLWASIGVPFGLLFDAHVGYHRISGEADASNGGTLNLDAEMATVGIKIGF